MLAVMEGHDDKLCDALLHEKINMTNTFTLITPVYHQVYMVYEIKRM